MQLRLIAPDEPFKARCKGECRLDKRHERLHPDIK
jgi:hypothetical protein